MHKFLKKLTNEEKHIEFKIPLKKLNNINNCFVEIDDFFIGKSGDDFLVFDKICDHNGAQLKIDLSKKTATCPLHGWRLNLDNGFYENGCRKKTLESRVEDGNLVIKKTQFFFSSIEQENLSETDIEFKFNAHASVSIDIDGINIISDPWLIGSCFSNGWWHSFPPSIEAIERLEQSDYIYISHNHPDHLHIPTLKNHANNNKKFLIPNFESKSVEKLLLRHGFNNLIICDFMQELYINSKNGGFKLIIIKSGDDRDDSSLIIYNRKCVTLLAVDTNMPNRWILPKVDILFTPFAGGASGFPVRIENFNKQEKIRISNANRLAVLNNHVKKLINATKPKYAIPYAGYFSEIERDNDVKNINFKNSPEDFIDYVTNTFKNVNCINPIESPHFIFTNGEVKIKEAFENPAYFVDEDYVSDTISRNLENLSSNINQTDLMSLGAAFYASSFIDYLTVILIPSDESITNEANLALILDFSEKNRNFQIINLNSQTNEQLSDEFYNSSNNLEILRVRSDSMSLVFRQGLPLEDLSIGFQAKMYRRPNIYNFSFWNHFTNIEFIKI